MEKQHIKNINKYHCNKKYVNYDIINMIYCEHCNVSHYTTYLYCIKDNKKNKTTVLKM